MSASEPLGGVTFTAWLSGVCFWWCAARLTKAPATNRSFRRCGCAKLSKNQRTVLQYS